MKESFARPLILEMLDDGHNYKLVEPFDYDTSLGMTITVPAGFVTDFASVPRIFWNLLPPTGRYGKAAVIHDYLYRTYGAGSKIVADAIFYEAMKALGVNAIVRGVMYLGVHWFGGRSYRGGL
jgi:hypothetical protein